MLDANIIGIELLEKLQLPQASKIKFIAQYLPIRLADAWGQFVDLTNIKI